MALLFTNWKNFSITHLLVNLLLREDSFDPKIPKKPKVYDYSSYSRAIQLLSIMKSAATF